MTKAKRKTHSPTRVARHPSTSPEVQGVFVCLADPTRRQIVEMLALHEKLPVSELRKPFKMSAPAISQHLKLLKDMQLVHVEKKAQQRIYSVNVAMLEVLDDWRALLNQDHSIEDQRGEERPKASHEEGALGAFLLRRAKKS